MCHWFFSTMMGWEGLNVWTSLATALFPLPKGPTYAHDVNYLYIKII